MSLQALRDADIARQAEWPGGDKVDILFRATELGGEVGEFLNAIKKIYRHRAGIQGNTMGEIDILNNLKDEAGDVVIALDLCLMDLGIDLWDCIVNKFNKTSIKNGLQTRLVG